VRRFVPAVWSSACRWLGTGLLCACVSGCGDAADEEHGAAIGAIVPFTGVSAASGASYERAMLLAIEYLNRASRASGQEFRLAEEDSHSTMERTQSGLQKLLRQDVLGIIGPDDVELVKGVRASIGRRPLAHLLPSSVTLQDFSGDTSGLLTRPAPAAEFVGCALANRVYGDLNERMVVVHASDAYRRAFASAAVESFESYRFAARIGHALALSLPEDSDDYLETVSAAAAFEPDTIVLAADAPIAAGFVRAWSTLGRRPASWFFEPGLRSEEFLRNVIVSSVNGASGISLALPDGADDFSAVYEKRLDGEPPSIESQM
jgi:ABC-type branched-subunit amino acid transport system substrate-binding protein